MTVPPQMQRITDGTREVGGDGLLRGWKGSAEARGRLPRGEEGDRARGGGAEWAAASEVSAARGGSPAPDKGVGPAGEAETVRRLARARPEDEPSVVTGRNGSRIASRAA